MIDTFERFTFDYNGAICRVYRDHVLLAGERIPMTLVREPLRTRIALAEIRHTYSILAETEAAERSQADSRNRAKAKRKVRSSRGHYGLTATGHQTRNR